MPDGSVPDLMADLNGGRECRVVMLDGTVPTFYRGVRYNTPVQVREANGIAGSEDCWIASSARAWRVYPGEGLVIPTSDECVREGCYVLCHGR